MNVSTRRSLEAFWYATPLPDLTAIPLMYRTSISQSVMFHRSVK
jgi:hypothetical protein